MMNMKILLSLVVPALVRGHVDAVNLGLVKMGGNFASYDSDNTGYESTSECEGISSTTIKSTVSPAVVSKNDPVTLSFTNPASYTPTTADWVGFYCSDDLESIPDRGYYDFAYTESPNSLTIAMNSGRQSECEFRFFTQSGDNKYCRTGVSDRIQVADAKTAISHRHLALTEDPTEMRISWTAGGDSAPAVRYGTDAENLDLTADGSCKTYKKTDMCESPANTEETFVDPGSLCTAVMKKLSADTPYFYAVTSDGSNWSDPIDFISAPPADPEYSFKFIAYGDMGTWSGTTPTGAASVATATISTAEVTNNDVRRVDHFGDISYARGCSATWDVWFDMIEPYAARVPYMVTIGNHEFDYVDGGENDPSINEDNDQEAFRPRWWNGGSDSGGECSVPMNNRFTMPDSSLSNAIYWYDFNYGSVHTIMMSSEHNITVGSPQYTFLEDSLKNVDRSVTPWVIVEMHRPMYNNEAYLSDYEVAVGMQGEFEDLLVQYDVDLVMAGHYHSYLRTSRVYKDKRDEEKGIYHMTVGSAGASLDETTLYEKDWLEKFSMEFGIARISVVNSTHMHWEYIENKDNGNTGAVVDETWIVKRYEENRLQEIKHCRLGMLGAFGLICHASNSGISVIEQFSSSDASPPSSTSPPQLAQRARRRVRRSPSSGAVAACPWWRVACRVLS